MKYRHHNGSFEDSMKTVQEFSTKEQLLNHLNDSLLVLVEEIKFEHKMLDLRNGWDTYFVLVRLKGDERFMVAGMSDGYFE